MNKNSELHDRLCDLKNHLDEIEYEISRCRDAADDVANLTGDEERLEKLENFAECVDKHGHLLSDLQNYIACNRSGMDYSTEKMFTDIVRVFKTIEELLA